MDGLPQDASTHSSLRVRSWQAQQEMDAVGVGYWEERHLRGTRQVIPHNSG